jgi:serine/threonine protein kinase/Flp pilus assembly protein TadD
MKGVKQSPETIFGEAIAIESPHDRSVFLERACQGAKDLQHAVERLVDNHFRAGNFLESPALDFAAVTSPESTEQPGSIIGPYKLLGQIGEGGFGVVYLAEQERPVRRRVALKVIKPGMDTRQVIARFEAERQALAMMDHPNIAKVHDAGATENGRPYFVMELVQGVPITEYCDQCNLTTQERVELFITVCQAVQHAHQKGIIHRDIKPTNVLVAIQDGHSAPKIIDFGVAKAVFNQQLTEHTLATGFTQIIGTPLYMSPEQAELSPLGIDTRTDIYSLGALLYELLTGTTPFEPARLKEANFDALRRIVREEDPPRPSARISSLAADLASTVAERRRTDVQGLSQTVRGDLDWIVMKCLEKDRNRRYETANDLARDIERHLADEPVQACPPSAGYRLRKLVRRNKISLAFVSLLMLAVATLAISNVRIKQNERRAIVESETSKEVADLLLTMLASANPDEAKGSEYTVRQLLDDFSARMADRLGDRPEVKATILATIGNAYGRLDMATAGEPHLKTALELRRRLYGDAHEKVADSLVDWAWNLRMQGRLAEAEPFLREAVEIHRRRGVGGDAPLSAFRILHHVLFTQCKHADAETVANEVLDVARKSGDVDHPEVAKILHDRAHWLVNVQRYAEAEQVARTAVDMHRRLHGANHPETAHGLHALHNALKAQQKLSEAKSTMREALSILHRYFTIDKDNVALFIRHLQQDIRDEGKSDELDALKRQEIELVTKETGQIIATAWVRRARAHALFDDWDQAVGAYSEALRVRPDFAGAWYDRARAFVHLRELGKAVDDYSKCVELDPTNSVYFVSRSRAYFDLRQYDKAIADCSKAIEIRQDDCGAWITRGNAHGAMEHFEKAIADYSRAAECEQNCDVYNQLAWALATCPDLKLRDPLRAVEIAKKALEIVPESDGPWPNHKQDAARQWYHKTVEWTDKKNATQEELFRFRTEAAELLGIPIPENDKPAIAADAPEGGEIQSQRTNN